MADRADDKDRIKAGGIEAEVAEWRNRGPIGETSEHRELPDLEKAFAVRACLLENFETMARQRR